MKISQFPPKKVTAFRIYLKKIEHVYFKFDPMVIDQKNGQADPSVQSSLKVMDELCKYIYSKDSTDRLVLKISMTMKNRLYAAVLRVVGRTNGRARREEVGNREVWPSSKTILAYCRKHKKGRTYLKQFLTFI